MSNVDSLHEEGIKAYQQGDFEKSDACFNKLLTLYRDAEDVENQVSTLTFLGEIQRAAGSLSASLRYYDQVEELLATETSGFHFAKLQNRRAATYFELRDLDKALRLSRKSQMIVRQIKGNLDLITSNLSIQGACFRDLGQNDSALWCIRGAMHVAKREGHSAEYITSLYNMAWYYDKANVLDSMFFYARKIISLSRGADERARIPMAYTLVSDYYARKGEYDLALKYFKRNSEVKDSILDAETKARFDEISAEHNRVFQEGERRLLNEKNRSARHLLVFAFLSTAFVLIGLWVYMRKSRFYKELSQLLKKQKVELDHKNSELEKTNSVKNKLLSVVAHDFKNPLNSLEGLISMYMQGDIDDEVFSVYLAKLHGQVVNTQELLDSLIIWSRSQLKGIEVHTSEFQLETELTKELKLLQPMAKAKGIHLEEQFDESGIVNSDKEILRFICRNLLTNAIKFTKVGGKVKITSTVDKGTLNIDVTDTGIGMDAKKLANLFSMNEQNTYGTKNEKGFGLGLNLCKEFAEHLKGTLTAKSKEGEGSSFLLRIPV